MLIARKIIEILFGIGGEDTKSMLQKLLEKYPTLNSLYDEKNNG